MAGTLATVDILASEQRALSTAVEWLERVATEAGLGESALLGPDVARALSILESGVLPLAAAEDEVMSGASHRAGTGDAARHVRHYHRQVLRLVADLETAHRAIGDELDDSTGRRLQRLLQRLRDLVADHIAHLDDDGLPAMDRGSSTAERAELREGISRALAWHRAGAT